jgi:hypothetical protein
VGVAALEALVLLKHSNHYKPVGKEETLPERRIEGTKLEGF